jgi:hypothetical protein
MKSPREKKAPLVPISPRLPFRGLDAHAVPSSPDSLRVSPGRSSLEKGKWHVFSDAQMATFKSVPAVELSIPETTVDFVVKTLMSPKWWESENKYSTTHVSLVGALSQGRVIYLRNVKTSVGPAKFRLRLWVTQWAMELEMGSCVIAHCNDEFDSCHLVSKFMVLPDKDKPNGVLVRYEELTSSPKFASFFIDLKGLF